MSLQIVLFFVLTLILTVILGGGQEATGLLAGQVILAQLAPGLASVILALIFRENAPGLNFSVKGITLKSVVGAVLFRWGRADRAADRHPDHPCDALRWSCYERIARVVDSDDHRGGG